RLAGDAAGLLHHLRGVAGVVPLEDLVHAVGVLEALVPWRVALHADAVGLVLEGARRLPLRGVVLVVVLLAGLAAPAFGRPGVLPRRRVVRARLGVEPGE